MNRFIKYGIGFVVVIIFGVVFYNKVFVPKHTFKIVTPKKSDMIIKVNGVGNVESENSYKVSAIYGGKITDFNIKIGQFINKGELVAQIDSIDLKDKIDEIKKNIDVIEANIKSLEIDKKSAYKDYLYQEEVLKKNRRLYHKKAISELEYKKYLTNRDISKLKVNSLAKKIISSKNQIMQLEATIKGLEERLKRYTIKAPVSGYVIKKYVSNYDVVGNYQPLIEIVNPKDIWIDTFIDTRLSSKVKIGQKTFIILRSGLKKEGYVYKINPVNNMVTNEREIFIKFKQTPIPFYINEQANINIKINKLTDIVTIPASAVVFYKQKQGVWIVKKHKAHFKPIEIIAHANKKVAVNLSNVEIIMPNPKKKPLSEGMKIYYD